MITSIIRLPDRWQLGSYANTILTPFGTAGRLIETSPALAFYKIVVTHGQYIIEYIVASTQNFDSSFRGMEERATGQIFTSPELINVAPISMKLITPEVCDNYLFVEPMNYLLTFCGTINWNDRDHVPLVTFSSPPNALTAPSYCEMCDTDMTGTVSMNTLVELLGEHFEPDVEVPMYTHVIDLGYLMPILRDNKNGKLEIKHIITVNDYGIYRWLFDTLALAKEYISKDQYPLLPDVNFSLLRERFDTVKSIILSEPLCGAFANTPSLVNLWAYRSYFAHPHTLQMYTGMANDTIAIDAAADDQHEIGTIDSRSEEFSTFNIRGLIDAVIYSPVTNIDLTATMNNVTTTLAIGWFGEIEECKYGGIKNWLRALVNTLSLSCKTTDVIIRFNKNWLDEIRFNIYINGKETSYYIPMWYYNLSSPYAINDTLITSMSNVFSKI